MVRAWVISRRGLGAIAVAAALSGVLFFFFSRGSTPQPPPEPAGQEPVRLAPVVIDPGHGGVDGGASAGPVLEKNLNLEIGRKLAVALQRRRIPVALTRDTDTQLSPLQSGKVWYSDRHRRDLQQRIEIARQAGGWALVSIHANYSNNPRGRGVVIFFQERDELSRYLADTIRQRLAERIRKPIDMLPAAFYIMRQGKVPVVMIEAGYLSNPEDRADLQREGYQQQLAEAVADAVAAVWREENP